MDSGMTDLTKLLDELEALKKATQVMTRSLGIPSRYEAQQEFKGALSDNWPLLLRYLRAEVEMEKALRAWVAWEDNGRGEPDVTDYDEEGAEHMRLMFADSIAALAASRKAGEEEKDA